MEAKDVIMEEVCSVNSSSIVVGGYEVSILSETVYYHQNGCMAVSCERKMCEEVHATGIPRIGGGIKWL